MKSYNSLYSVLSVGLIALFVSTVWLFTASCGGGSSQIIQPPNQNGTNGDNGITPPDGDGGDDGGTTPQRVAPSVVGTIDVNGIPVADEGGLPADVTRTTLKVIDPSEEIGDSPAVVPTPEGTYTIDGLESANLSYLNISFNTTIDLEGIGETITPVSVNLPIQLADGVVTAVDTSIAIYTPKVTAADRFGSGDKGDDIDDDWPGNDNDGQDDNGNDDDNGNSGGDDDDDDGAIEINYSYSGPDGARTGKFIIDYRANQTIYDLDDDGDYLDDAPHMDDDNDGIGDDRNYDDRNREQFIEIEVEGSVESIGAGFLKVRTITFVVNERTNFKDNIKLTQIPVGSRVKVKGFKTPSDFVYAEEIELV